MKAFLLLLLACLVSVCIGGDGVTAHFTFGLWPPTIEPLIVADHLGWVRDDVLWYNMEKSKGVYQQDPEWERVASTADQQGLSVIGNIGNNTLYSDSYDPVAYAAFAKWFAQDMLRHPSVKAIEITNEPNNHYAQTEGGNWHALYTTLLEMVYSAIKSVRPDMIVVGGGGANDGDIEYFQTHGANKSADAWSWHPYPNSQSDYDGSSFISFVNHRRAFSLAAGASLREFDTEWGYAWTRDPTYFARRIVLNHALGIEVNCIYEIVDESGSNGNFGLLTTSLTKNPAYDVVGNTISILDGLNPGTPEAASANSPGYVYGFDSPDGSRSAVAWWDGGGYWITTTRTCTISWKHPNAGAVSMFDPATGATTPLPWHTLSTDPTIVVADVPTGVSVKFLIIQSALAPAAPTNLHTI